MTDYQIPQSAIEAAARATVLGGKNERGGDWDGLTEDERQAWREGTEVALRAAFDELGMNVAYWDRSGPRTHYKLESRWMPVEKPSDEVMPTYECAICGQTTSFLLNGEGECPGCEDEKAEREESEP